MVLCKERGIVTIRKAQQMRAFTLVFDMHSKKKNLITANLTMPKIMMMYGELAHHPTIHMEIFFPWCAVVPNH